MRACLLVLSVLSSLIPLSGRQSTLGPMSGPHEEAYKLRLPREAKTASVPKSLKVVKQPRYAAKNVRFVEQPEVQLLDEDGKVCRVPKPDGTPWQIEAIGGQKTSALIGKTKVDADTNGRAVFRDLGVESQVTNYHLIFRVKVNGTNIDTRSEAINVERSKYALALNGGVRVRYLKPYDERTVFLEMELVIQDQFTKSPINITEESWQYHIKLWPYNPKLGVKLNETSSKGNFSSSPFNLPKVILTGWVYRQQLRINVWPTDQPSVFTDDDIFHDTQPFNTVRPPTAELKALAIRHKLSIKINATDPDQADPKHAVWAFLNEFGIRNGSQAWSDCALHVTEETKMEWQISGKIREVLRTATALYEKSKRFATFSFDKHTWTLLPQSMVFLGEPFYGNDSPPPVPAFTIGGILYSHVLLGVVIAVMILPVFYLCVTWKRHERLMQEAYQARLQSYAHPPPPKGKKKPKKSKKPVTEQPTRNVEADQSNNGHVNTAPPFYIDTAPPPADILPGHVFNAQDEWKMAAASAPLYPSFNPTGDGLPPPRFRWSAPEKTEMMELTMSQLKQQHRDFMEQTAGGGGNLSFSRYSSSGGDPFCLDDIESTQAAFQEVSFDPPSSVRIIPPATASRPLTQEAMEQLARNLKERAPQKTLSAPTIPTISTQSPNNKGGVSKIVVAPIIDTCPLPGGVATEPTHTRPIRQNSLPEPQ